MSRESQNENEYAMSEQIETLEMKIENLEGTILEQASKIEDLQGIVQSYQEALDGAIRALKTVTTKVGAP